MKALQLSGQKFGRLKVIKRNGSRFGESFWDCVCLCGNTVSVAASSLRGGSTRSCGCLQKDRASQANSTHRMCDSTVYAIWASMKQRCTDISSTAYPYYGGRGIEVCHEWINSFEQFYIDMGDPPAGLSIDREDNDGNYEPGNCRWATRIEQANNKRSNIVMSYDGFTLTLAQWARRKGIPRNALYLRIKSGSSIEKALNDPYKKRVIRYFTYKGETKIMAAFARQYHVDYGKLKLRVLRGWTIDRAIERG